MYRIHPKKGEGHTPTEPPTIVPSYSPTHLKEDCKRLFTTPLHSLLQFIPIGIWILMVQESNKYANEKIKTQSQTSMKGTISGKPWKFSNISWLYPT